MKLATSVRNSISVIMILLQVGCGNLPEQHEHRIESQYSLVKDSGRYRTLNQTGWIVSDLDEVSMAFIDGINKDSRVLEIGAGFGYVSKQALKKGAVVYANDIDQRHLHIIKESTSDIQTGKLHLVEAKFPSNMQIENGSLDAIIAQRVLHFLSGAQLEQGAKVMHDLLKPGGKVYITVNTPYMKPWVNFIPVYEKAKEQGQKYPGYVRNPAEYNKIRAKNVTTPVHFLDMDILSKVLKNAGFKIDKNFYLDNTSKYFDEIRLDGREAVGLIASKY